MSVKVNLDRVLEIARELPDVKVSDGRGSWSLKSGGQMLACPAIHKSAEPGSLVVKIDLSEREELISAQGDIYYLTEHYAPYPSVLVRLAKIDRESLLALLKRAQAFVSRSRSAGRGGARARRGGRSGRR